MHRFASEGALIFDIGGVPNSSVTERQSVPKTQVFVATIAGRMGAAMPTRPKGGRWNVRNRVWNFVGEAGNLTRIVEVKYEGALRGLIHAAYSLFLF